MYDVRIIMCCLLHLGKFCGVSISRSTVKLYSLFHNYSIQVVKTMHKIAREAESAVYHKQLVEELRLLTPRPTDVTHTTALAAVEASVNCLAAAIVVITTTGR